MPVEMERVAVSARGCKERGAESSDRRRYLLHAGEAALLRARWRIYLPSRGLLHSAPVVCLPLRGDQPQHASRVVFRSAGLRLPAFCPAWNNSRATADRER